jgi:predicted phage terminase large subunit-like protein
MQGRNLAFAAFDELTHFTEFQWWYVYTRLRSQCGINPYMRGTLNPEPDSWVTTYLKDLGYVDRESGYAIPEMDGAIKYICRHDGKVLGFDSHSECHTYLRDIGDRKQKPRSFTYIAGKLAENKIMLAENPDYESNLAMSDAATVARLLYGNFNARAEPGSVFDRTWFDVIQDVPDQTQWLSAVRGWDRAGSKPSEGYRDPDWTRSVLLVRLKQGPTAVLDCTGLRDTPGAVDKHLLQVARLDGPRVIQAFDQDPGQAGVREREQIEKMFKEHLPSHKVIFQPTGGKDKALRARPFAAHCRNERMLIVNRPWSSEYLAELERFPTKGYHDDQVDASSTAYRELGFGAPDHAARFIAAHRHAKP